MLEIKQASVGSKTPIQQFKYNSHNCACVHVCVRARLPACVCVWLGGWTSVEGALPRNQTPGFIAPTVLGAVCVVVRVS